MAVRILSALVGIIIGVAILLFDNKWVYIIAVAFFGSVGVWEITRAVKCDKHKVLRWICVIFAGFVPFLFGVEALGAYIVPAFFVFLLCVFCNLLAFHKSLNFSDAAMCACSAIAIPSSLNCILEVRYSMPDDGTGLFMIFYILFCAWFGDSGAYFVGTFLGKHKLCPEISPKKTVEGFIGGILTVGVVALVQCLVYNLLLSDGLQVSYAVLVPVGMAASAAGVLGDLTASVIKRQYNVKDFGNIMPGHGGVMDRFDSVLFTAPFLYVVFSIIDPVV